MKLHNTPMPVLLGLSHRLVIKKFKQLIEALGLGTSGVGFVSAC